MSKPFNCRLTRGEKLFGWLFLPFFAVGSSFLMSLVYLLLLRQGVELSDMAANIALYLPSMLLVMLVMRRFLRASYDVLLDDFGQTVLSIFGCFGLFLFLSLAVALFMGLISGGELVETDNPNQAAVMEQSATDFYRMFATAVFMAPVVEECLFRGVVFGTIREKSRPLAWVVTIVLFAFYHLWVSFVTEYDSRLWLYLLDYLPGGVALCLCYEKSGTIWGPIFLHMLSNGVALWSQRG